MTVEALQILSLVAARDADVVAADCTPPPVPGLQTSVQQYVMYVDGDQTVWIAFNQVATVPGSGATGTGFPLGAGSTNVFSVPPGATVSVIAVNAGSTLYVASGKGV